MIKTWPKTRCCGSDTSLLLRHVFSTPSLFTWTTLLFIPLVRNTPGFQLSIPVISLLLLTSFIKGKCYSCYKPVSFLVAVVMNHYSIPCSHACIFKIQRKSDVDFNIKWLLYWNWVNGNTFNRGFILSTKSQFVWVRESCWVI